MNILVTGAFGRIGSQVVEKALSLGHQVKCIDIDTQENRKLAKNKANECEIVLQDLSKTDDFHHLLKNINVVIHCACLLPPVSEQNVALSDLVNIEVSKRLIDAIESSNSDIHFIFPSSVSVFAVDGDLHKKRTVADVTHAHNHYARQKLAIEAYLQKSKVIFSILRVGVSVDSGTLSTDRNTFRQLLSIRHDFPFHYVHPKDVATAMCHCINNEQTYAKTFLIGGDSSCEVTMYRFLSVAFNALGLTLPQSVFGDHDYDTQWMDVEESHNILNYQHHGFQAYQQEMEKKLKLAKYLLWPFKWIINRSLGFLLKKI